MVKYRQNVFVEDHELINFMKTTFKDISEEYGADIEEIECGMDHIHVLVSTKPTLNMSSYINALKGRSSRYVRKAFHDFLKYKFWGNHFWSPSYFIATTGKVSINVLKHYIENLNRRYN
ncbi:MAG: transposase [Promethearchaeota archaeon]|nr:MAG: transposase [Candidatus Lokiarchaeota archaeon]